MVSYYTGDRPGDVPGNLPDPYFWWECGAMFGALIDYYYFTGDSQYNEMVMRGMIHQVGENEDYLPRNQSSTSVRVTSPFPGRPAQLCCCCCCCRGVSVVSCGQALDAG